MASVFDPVPVKRPDAEWRQLLVGLMESLSDFTGIRFSPTAWRIWDEPGNPHASGCVDVRGIVNPTLLLTACGTVTVNAIDRRAAEVGAVLLLFASGRRVSGPSGAELVVLHYRPSGWWYEGWVADECTAFAEHGTDAWWSGAEPGAAADGGA